MDPPTTVSMAARAHSLYFYTHYLFFCTYLWQTGRLRTRILTHAWLTIFSDVYSNLAWENNVFYIIIYQSSTNRASNTRWWRLMQYLCGAARYIIFGIASNRQNDGATRIRTCLFRFVPSHTSQAERPAKNLPNHHRLVKDIESYNYYIGNSNPLLSIILSNQKWLLWQHLTSKFYVHLSGSISTTGQATHYMVSVYVSVCSITM